MKKYLMMALAALAIVSCSKSDDVSEAGRSKKGDMYESVFTETFGKVNSNVNWGFNAAKIVSLDENGAVVTRSANVNRNEWGTGNGVGGNVAVPANVTTSERTLVYNYFNQKREGAVNQYNIAWADFFVTQVHKGTTSYKDGADGDVVGSDKMNHLQCSKQLRNSEGSIDANGNLVGSWEHINDFNDASQWSGYGTIEGHTYMQSSGTLDFAYHNTVDSKYHNEYIIIPGAEIDASLAGYYYVGFDFYATHPTGQEANKNMDVERDWFFTDWIVRISPAEFTNAQRVMAEDLIATSLTDVDASDWDFNDAVFDVAFMNEWVASLNTNKLVAHITLHAAGGTKALTVGNKEVHNLFGVSTETMVNTNAGSVGKAVDNLAPVQFTYIVGDADNSGTIHTADEVPVFVGTVELKAEQGKAPQKIVTSTSTRWMKERKLITTGYAQFGNYVSNNSPQDWYGTVSDASKLY